MKSAAQNEMIVLWPQAVAGPEEGLNIVIYRRVANARPASGSRLGACSTAGCTGSCRSALGAQGRPATVARSRLLQ